MSIKESLTVPINGIAKVQGQNAYRALAIQRNVLVNGQLMNRLIFHKEGGTSNGPDGWPIDEAKTNFTVVAGHPIIHAEAVGKYGTATFLLRIECDAIETDFVGERGFASFELYFEEDATIRGVHYKKGDKLPNPGYERYETMAAAPCQINPSGPVPIP